MHIKHTQTVWQNDAWQLVESTIELPDGAELVKGHIRHPGSVLLLPLRPSAAGLEVLLIRQFRLALATTILELPAGTREADEDWLVCAQRELREETGYRAEQLTHLGDIWPAPGLTDELMKIYLAENLSPAPLAGDIDEQIEVVPFPLADCRLMATDGRLQDAKSIIAIHRLDAHLAQPQ